MEIIKIKNSTCSAKWKYSLEQVTSKCICSVCWVVARLNESVCGVRWVWGCKSPSRYSFNWPPAACQMPPWRVPCRDERWAAMKPHCPSAAGLWSAHTSQEEPCVFVHFFYYHQCQLFLLLMQVHGVKNRFTLWKRECVIMIIFMPYAKWIHIFLPLDKALWYCSYIGGLMARSHKTIWLAHGCISRWVSYAEAWQNRLLFQKFSVSMNRHKVMGQKFNHNHNKKKKIGAIEILFFNYWL